MTALPENVAWYGFVVFGWAALGWVAGIALNRIIHQLPRDRSPWSAPICEGCGQPVPTVSLVTRPCRACGQSMGFDRTEWLTAVLLTVLAIRFGPTGTLVAYSIYTFVLLIVAGVDLRHRYVYSIVIYPSAVIAAILTPLLTGVDVTATLIGIGVGFGVFLAFYLFGRLIYRGGEPIGKGDIEIAALAGAMVGHPRVLSALFLGGIANAVFILILVVAGRRGRRDFVPYGPGMCLGIYWAFFLPV